MEKFKLFMVLIGCKPAGRHTEQHDVFFGIGKGLDELLPEMKAFWPEAKGRIHIDVWREVTYVDGYHVGIVSAEHGQILPVENVPPQLFFLNLGGYKENEFEEYHYKMLSVGIDLSVALKQAKQTAFYKHAGFKGAASHIDDKYGIDVDDIYRVADILVPAAREQYKIILTADDNEAEDEWHIGYLKLGNIKSQTL